MDAEGRKPIIRVEDVHLRFGRTEVLRGVSFEVPAGKTLCILGGSGGGKSTLLKVMIGNLRPSSGRVVIDGEDISRMDEKALNRVRRKFGVMFQLGALLNSMSVAENVALPLEYHTRLDPEVIRTMVKIKLKQVDLLHAADRRPSQISGGMQKRAAVARALALDPKILFYDEPSAGLDPVATTRIDQLINMLKTTLGMTNVVVTHVMESVFRIADRVVMLERGRVLLDGSLSDLRSSTHPTIKQFVSGELLPAESGGQRDEAFIKELLM
jgi:phospholipid/cholesterol/gamma-HCH transport system ATP-binding protein